MMESSDSIVGFWAVLFGLFLANLVLYWVKVRRYVSGREERQEALRLSRKIIIFGFTPFIAMGFLLTFNWVDEIADFFRVYQLNPFVCLWYLLIGVEALLFIAWLKKGGASLFIKYPFLVNRQFGTVGAVNRVFVAIFIFAFVGIALVQTLFYLQVFPAP